MMMWGTFPALWWYNIRVCSHPVSSSKHQWEYLKLKAWKTPQLARNSERELFGGFLQWGYPQMDGKIPPRNGWFRGTPIFGTPHFFPRDPDFLGTPWCHACPIEHGGLSKWSKCATSGILHPSDNSEGCGATVKRYRWSRQSGDKYW